MVDKGDWGLRRGGSPFEKKDELCQCCGRRSVEAQQGEGLRRGVNVEADGLLTVEIGRRTGGEKQTHCTIAVGSH